jgi:hypothetical protein
MLGGGYRETHTDSNVISYAFFQNKESRPKKEHLPNTLIRQPCLEPVDHNSINTHEKPRDIISQGNEEIKHRIPKKVRKNVT